MLSPVRFSSCRGVAIEIKLHADPFSVTTSPPLEELPPLSSERRLPWSRESHSWLTSSTLTLRSTSKVSSHYCDLNLELDKDEDDGYDRGEHFFLGVLEEGDFLLQPCKASVCALWVAKGIKQNFGKEIKGMMSGHPKGKVIVHDTIMSGQPNVAEMSVEAAKRWGAEVVVITRFPKGSRDVVKACKAKRDICLWSHLGH